MLCGISDRLMWSIVVQEGAARVYGELSGDRRRLDVNGTKERRGWI